jgi:cytoskeletal protein CcmA (bactofilin family)
MLSRLKRKETKTATPAVLPEKDIESEPESGSDEMKLFERDSTQLEATVDDSTPQKDGAIMDSFSRQKELEEASQDSSVTARDDGLSVIGKTLSVKGEVEAAEDMLVEGRVEGSIKHTANRLIVGTSGVVNADIDAKNLIIEGTVEGNVVGSESVVIKASADVRGNIYTARISIDDGAQFSGTVDMDLSRSPKH